MRWQAIPAVKATAAGLVLAAAALAGAAAAQAAPSAASPSLALPGRLYGVAATSTTNASAKGYWAVGSTDWARTLVRHWNGKAPKIGAAQPAGSWGRAVEVPGLGALNTGGQAGVASVSCGSAGSCAAGGDYQNHGHQGFVVIERHGRWGQAIEVPGLGALNTGGYAQVALVSCAPAGSCAAGGYYSEPHSEQGFVASERHGRWGQAIAVPGLAALNTGRQAEVSSVSCGSAGSCAAGGYYSHGDLGRRGFVAVERDGFWGEAIEVPGLAALNKDDYAEVTSVSCASAGSCAAGGYYTYGGGNEQGFVAVERHGIWGTAIQVPGLAALNTGAGAGVSSVSCVPAGSCTAVGGYTDRRDHSLGFVAVERHGRWGKAIGVPGLAALSKGDAGSLSVSCGSAGSCAADGQYRNHGLQGFVVVERRGRWGTAIQVPGLKALNTGKLAEATSVSCASAGSCAAGGYYFDRHRHAQWFVTVERRGHWGTAIQVPGLKALNKPADVEVFPNYFSVSCAPAGTCAAGGYYTDHHGAMQGFVTRAR